MSAHYSAVVQCPIAAVRIGVVTDAEGLQRILFLGESVPLVSPQSPLAGRVVAQLAAYFQTAAYAFELPARARGTAFQQRVWRAISSIDVGRVATYGDIAKRLGSSAQAVGNACGVNPLPILVPCHRVVAKGGLGGFMGQGEGDCLAIKHWLLRHERAL